jgi:hypothetical protein
LLFKNQEESKVNRNNRCIDGNHDVELGNQKQNQVENVDEQIHRVGYIARFVDRLVVLFLIYCEDHSSKNDKRLFSPFQHLNA